MTTPRDLRDDDALLAVVGRALADDPVVEPGDDVAVPDEVVAVARAAFQLRDIDDELAELVHDSLHDEPMLVRHEATLNRLLSYVSSRLGLDVELEADGRTLMGVVTPAGPADVEIETATTIDRTSGRRARSVPGRAPRLVPRPRAGRRRHAGHAGHRPLTPISAR